MATVSFHFLGCFWLCFSLRLLIACSDGQCREVEFPSFYFFAGKRLVKHNIKTLQVPGIDACELLCYHEPNCVSINFLALADDNRKYKCELSNSTHQEHETDFVDAPTHFYRGAKNACGSGTEIPCENGGTCQSGFTDKGYRCLCPPGITGEHCEEPEPVREAFFFPRNGVKDYVIVQGMPSLKELTACFWMRSNDKANAGTPISYAVRKGHKNEFTFRNYKSFDLFVGGERRETGVKATDGKWHHICATWENTAGSLNIYKDGKLEKQKKHHDHQPLQREYVIPGGGSLVLGQEQDSVGGGFDRHQSFIGEMTGVNIWSRVLDDQEIAALSNSCLAGEGDVFKWSDFKNHTRGGVQLINATCAA